MLYICVIFVYCNFCLCELYQETIFTLRPFLPEVSSNGKRKGLLLVLRLGLSLISSKSSILPCVHQLKQIIYITRHKLKYISYFYMDVLQIKNICTQSKKVLKIVRMYTFKVSYHLSSYLGLKIKRNIIISLQFNLNCLNVRIVIYFLDFYYIHKKKISVQYRQS